MSAAESDTEVSAVEEVQGDPPTEPIAVIVPAPLTLEELQRQIAELTVRHTKDVSDLSNRNKDLELELLRERDSRREAETQLLKKQFAEGSKGKVADALLHTDASKSGWGGVLNSKVPATGFWKAHQRQEHITALELRAVRLSVLSFIKELKGRRVLHFCDNMAVVHILTNITARTPSMMAELRKLFWILDVNDIHLRTRHIRSAANVWADRLSRRFDCGDWRLSREEFSYLDRRYGPHSVDRFATNLNTQLPVFNSSMHCPDVSARSLAPLWCRQCRLRCHKRPPRHLPLRRLGSGLRCDAGRLHRPLVALDT